MTLFSFTGPYSDENLTKAEIYSWNEWAGWNHNKSQFVHIATHCTPFYGIFIPDFEMSSTIANSICLTITNHLVRWNFVNWKGSDECPIQCSFKAHEDSMPLWEKYCFQTGEWIYNLVSAPFQDWSSRSYDTLDGTNPKLDHCSFRWASLLVVKRGQTLLWVCETLSNMPKGKLFC